MPLWLTITLSVSGVAVWVFVGAYHGVHAVRAWREAARLFPDQAFVPRKTFKKLHGFGPGVSSNSFTLEVNEDGVRLSIPAILIDLGLCLPLFFPWSAVRAICPERYYLFPNAFKIEIAGLASCVRFWSILWRHENAVEELSAWRNRSAPKIPA